MTFEVVIVGSVHNVGYGKLRKEVKTIESALPKKAKKTWFVVESNSTKVGSIDALAKIAAKKSNFSFISLGEDRSGSRIERISRARNEYLKFLRSTFNQQDCADAVCIVADLDGLNSSLEIPASCLKEVVEVGQVHFANQTGPYYDVSALRHELWCPVDPWQDFEGLKGLLGNQLAYQLAIKSKQIRVPKRSPKIEVQSAFGGLGIYPLRVLVGSKATYQPLNSFGVEECEHVGFHAALASEGVKLFINPRLINAKYTEHTRYERPILGALLRIRALVASNLPSKMRAYLVKKIFS